MFGRVGGSAQTIILIAIAILAVVGGSIYLYSHFSSGGSTDMRTYHCNSCDKDFQADVNTLGNSLPKCPSCDKTDDVTMTQKSR